MARTASHTKQRQMIDKQGSPSKHYHYAQDDVLRTFINQNSPSVPFEELVVSLGYSKGLTDEICQQYLLSSSPCPMLTPPRSQTEFISFSQDFTSVSPQHLQFPRLVSEEESTEEEEETEVEVEVEVKAKQKSKKRPRSASDSASSSTSEEETEVEVEVEVSQKSKKRPRSATNSTSSSSTPYRRRGRLSRGSSKNGSYFAEKVDFGTEADYREFFGLPKK